MNFMNHSYVGEVIKQAVQSNCIKLNGAGTTTAASKEFAEADAAYLLELYNRLTGTVKPQGS